MAQPAGVFRHAFLDSAGKPLAGGLVYLYLAGTTTPASAYRDRDLQVPHEWPVRLDAGGWATIYLPGGTTYDVVVTDRAGTTVQSVQTIEVLDPSSAQPIVDLASQATPPSPSGPVSARVYYEGARRLLWASSQALPYRSLWAQTVWPLGGDSRAVMVQSAYEPIAGAIEAEIDTTVIGDRRPSFAVCASTNGVACATVRLVDLTSDPPTEIAGSAIGFTQATMTFASRPVTLPTGMRRYRAEARVSPGAELIVSDARLVVFGRLEGHADAAHTDVHGDASHADVPHEDVQHTDQPHLDTQHQDVAHGDTHQDVAHQDTSHVDTHQDVSHTDTHTDTHTDVPHQDSNHGDVAHGDSHTDTPHGDSSHADTHNDVAHSDAHGDEQHADTHGDQPHDDHQDVFHQDHDDDVFHQDLSGEVHDDVAHDDVHGDTAPTNTHDDVAHQDSHGDSPHQDVAHGDETTNTPHTDSQHADSPHQDSHQDTHSDVVHQDAHGDTPHADSHTDQHTDTAHADAGHQDSAHGDTPHTDVSHGDAGHSDAHCDVAHGDQTPSP
jgi:hypothetical protein